MEYLATFYTHYGSMRFHKHCEKEGIAAKMMPVPRELSASCGVCVRFAAVSAPKITDHEDMERCYVIASDDVYTLVEGAEG